MLCDPDYIEGLVGAPLSEGTKDNLKMLAECTYHILTASSYGEPAVNYNQQIFGSDF